LTNFQFFIHWIPSHIENTSFGRLATKGNAKSDQLGDEARLFVSASTDHNFFWGRDFWMKVAPIASSAQGAHFHLFCMG
jgi:hypothetical protein